MGVVLLVLIAVRRQSQDKSKHNDPRLQSLKIQAMLKIKIKTGGAASGMPAIAASTPPGPKSDDASNKDNSKPAPTPSTPPKQANAGQSQSESNNEQLYCICRQPYIEGEFMFACDAKKPDGQQCSNWFHPMCMLAAPMDANEYAQRVTSFTCHECSGTGKARVVWFTSPDPAKDGPIKEKVTEIDPEKALERRNKAKRTTAASAGTAARVADGGIKEAIDYLALVDSHRSLITPAPWPALDSGYDLKVEYLNENGMTHPFLLRSTQGLGLRIPDSLKAREAMDHLGPSYPISAIDVRFQAAEPMTLAQFVSYLETPEKDRHRVLNSISVEFSETPLANLVDRPSVVGQLDWDAMGVWPLGDPEKKPSKIGLYWLCGAKGSYTEWVVPSFLVAAIIVP